MMRAMLAGKLLCKEKRFTTATAYPKAHNFVQYINIATYTSSATARKPTPSPFSAAKRKTSIPSKTQQGYAPVIDHNIKNEKPVNSKKKGAKSKAKKAVLQEEGEKPPKTPEQIAKMKERQKKRRKSQRHQIIDRLPEKLEPIAPKELKNFYKKQPLCYKRVDKLLSNCNFASRKHIRSWMARNNVTIKVGEEVDGNEVREVLQRANVSDLTLLKHIRINGKPIPETTLPKAIVLNKPRGYSCTHVRDEPESKIVFDLLPASFSSDATKYSIAGRLDKWASGVCVLSVDGQFIQKIIHPKVEIEKSYLVQLKHQVKGDEEEKFASGEIKLRSEKKACKPARFQNIDVQSKIARIVLKEGKYHQIRRMIASVGNLVLTVHRERLGILNVDDLKPGAWRPLTEQEIQYFIDPSIRTSVQVKEETSVDTIKQVLSQGGLDSARIFEKKKAENENKIDAIVDPKE